MKKIKIGDNIHCPATGNMEWPFTAKVLKRYENSYLVAIIAFDHRDRWNVRKRSLNGYMVRAVASLYA
ncbi:hypothetical protein EFT87_14920 [Schleiferilactobacillus harbinensis]|uniref:hypothetical protein n=1 Tax=Schleiferilactobacillus harbinensis TaxID=304207 RepID=UPI0021A5DE3E|nr:hypothetical protein [Schleiferilactobacillus harbinensis]MCT2909924.1 hypothetical protein [Schleiferilactobacillus harbinensis]